MNVEFQRGDTVTFHAFHEERIAAKVVEVITLFEEPKYRLEGISKGLVTITSGRSIRESKYFIEPDKEFKW